MHLNNSNNSNKPNELNKNYSLGNINKKKSQTNTQKICVIIRKRPLSQKEIVNKDEDIISVNEEKNSIIVKEKKLKVDLTKYIEEHNFNFDLVFDEKKTNEQIYLKTVRPMIQYTFSNNAKITCFAYGQTGSGKTFTMMGNNETNPGLYLLASYDIFSLIETKYKNICIYIAFYEIYCGKIFDLLNSRKNLNILEDSKGQINIVGITEIQVNDLNSLINIINYGINLRSVGITGANNDSSRSHGIIQINLKDIKNKKLKGKISFIDLAGSERAKDTLNTNKQTKFDGAEINKSLLALKECIRALDHCKKHTPFRGSKLTLVLRDSFIGNCKTLMIANISPCQSSSEDTLNTLRYADRVKELKKRNESKEKNYHSGGKKINNKFSRNNHKIIKNVIPNKISFNKTYSNCFNAFEKKSNNNEQNDNKIENKICKNSTRTIINNSLDLDNSLNNSDLIKSKTTDNSINKIKKKCNSNNDIVDINDNSNYTNNEKNNNKKQNNISSVIMKNNDQIKVKTNFNINTLNFLNEYTSYKNYINNSIEDPEEIKRKHEEYINQINLKRNEMLVEHKIHIGNMVHFLQKELDIIKTINNNLDENPDFLYETLEKNYEEQNTSISKMKNNIKDLRNIIQMSEKFYK